MSLTVVPNVLKNHACWYCARGATQGTVSSVGEMLVTCTALYVFVIVYLASINQLARLGSPITSIQGANVRLLSQSIYITQVAQLIPCISIVADQEIVYLAIPPVQWSCVWFHEIVCDLLTTFENWCFDCVIYVTKII